MSQIKVIFAIACLGMSVLAGCAPPSEPAATIGAPAQTSGSQEATSGIDKSALAAVMALGPQVGIFFYPDKIDPAQKAAAPAKVCAAQGRTVDSFKDVPLEHPESLPGARHLVVYCK